MPVILSMLDISFEDIEIRLAKIIGQIVYELSKHDLHLKYVDNFIKFFISICNNKEVEMRRQGIFNLACFNMLYKDIQEDLGIDFYDMFL